MTEKDEIMLARKYTPVAVRVLAQLAREADSASDRKDAIAMLVARRLLATHHPTDDDLRRIENMTDDEINDVFRRASH